MHNDVSMHNMDDHMHIHDIYYDIDVHNYLCMHNIICVMHANDNNMSNDIWTCNMGHDMHMHAIHGYMLDAYLGFNPHP